MLIKQTGRKETPGDGLNNAQLTLSFLKINEKGSTEAERHCVIGKTLELNQFIHYKFVLPSVWKVAMYCFGDMELFLPPQEMRSYGYNYN